MTIQACILEIKNAAKNAGVELLEEEVLDILDILGNGRYESSIFLFSSPTNCLRPRG